MKLKNFLKYSIILMISLIMNSCYSYRIPGNYTTNGYKNYIESEKRISKEKRDYKKWHRKNNNRIYKLQNK